MPLLLILFVMLTDPDCLFLPLTGQDSARADDSEIRFPEQEPVSKVMLLPPGPGNPRNSEGDFIKLEDGRILFIYSHFTDNPGDFGQAYLASRFSDDEGKTWSDEDAIVLPNEGKTNIMSVSLLRLSDNSIALFYLRKNSDTDCRLFMRTSKDEAITWSRPRLCFRDGWDISLQIMTG